MNKQVIYNSINSTKYTYLVRDKSNFFIINQIFDSKNIALTDIIKLTQREHDCLKLLLTGKSAKEIGRILAISHRTAESHINSLKMKTGCRTRMEIICKFTSNSTF